jgi:hypothetical protein
VRDDLFFRGFFIVRPAPDPLPRALPKGLPRTIDLTPTPTLIPNQPFVKKFSGLFFVFGFF